MAVALGGLTGLYGPEAPMGEQGRDPREFGGPPDKRHAIPAQSSAPAREYHGTAYPPQIDHDEVVESTPAPGRPYNDTPPSHAAPYPAGLTHDPLVAAEQLRTLHGLDMGGSAQTYAVGTPYEANVDAGRYDSPNSSALAAIPAQLKAGSHDPAQGYGVDPGYGFQFGRLFRRSYTDNTPIDRTGTVHGERPFWGAHPVVQQSFDGEDSPYGDLGDTHTGMMLGPTPAGAPTPYAQPPNPGMAATSDYPESGFAW